MNQEYNFSQYENYQRMKKNYMAKYGLTIDGWIYAGWIADKPCVSTFKELVYSSLTSDHGEQRIVIPKEDGNGVNCFWRETK